MTYFIKDKGLGPYNEFYTDGSKHNGKIGCAYVYYINGVEVMSRKFRLGDQDLMFKAELLAIVKVIDYITKLNNNDCYSIITD